MSTLSPALLLAPTIGIQHGIRFQFRREVQELIAFLGSIDALAADAPFATATVAEWQTTAQMLDTTITLLESEAGAGMLMLVRALVPDLGPRYEALSERAKIKAQQFLDRLEDEVLLAGWAHEAASEPGPSVPLDVVARELSDAAARSAA